MGFTSAEDVAKQARGSVGTFPWHEVCGVAQLGEGWGWGEVEAVLRKDSAALDLQSVWEDAVEVGYVQVVSCLLPFVDTTAEAVPQERLAELLSWRNGAHIASELPPLQEACQAAGIAPTPQHTDSLGQILVVVQLDTMLPNQLTDLDTLACLPQNSSEPILFPPACATRHAPES